MRRVDFDDRRPVLAIYCGSTPPTTAFAAACDFTRTRSSAPNPPTPSICRRCSTSWRTFSCNRDSPAAGTSIPTGASSAATSDRSLDALREAILERAARERPVHARDAGSAARRWRRSVAGQAGTAARRPRPAAGGRGISSTCRRRRRCRAGSNRSWGPGGLAHAAAKDVQFNLTDKGIDFLGYRTLRHILGSLGKSSFGSHDTPYLATGIEADGFSKPYEFGDTLNLDVSETLKNALARTGKLGSAAGPRLRRPHGAPGGVPLVVRDRAHARHVALDDPVRRGSLHTGQEGRARPDASHPHAVPRRHDPRHPVPRFGRGDPAGAAGPRAGRSLPHEHRRRIQARAPDPHDAEEGHAPDRDDHRRQAQRPDDAQRPDLQELDGTRRDRHRADAAGGRRLPAQPAS